MPYEVFSGDICREKKIHVVDLRSDTISRPTNEMREAMRYAEVGDDVYEEDPTVDLLEERSAKLMGKEDALFVPSGTMANLIAIMVHCTQRGSELIAGDKSHIYTLEQCGATQIAGVHMEPVINNDDGTFSLEELNSKLRTNPDVLHELKTNLIVVENTHNMCGGKVLPLEFLDDLSKIAKPHNIPLHMDGARIFNAAVYSKVPASRIARDMDSVCFCYSKGLGCPIGSVLCGSKSFIAKAKSVRKLLGGSMRQVGIVASAALIALNHMIDRLQVDHDHTYKIAKAIDDLKSDIIKVELATVQTNIFMIHLDPTRVSAKEFLHRISTVLETDSVKVSIKACSRYLGVIRFVLFWEITDDDVNQAIEKLRLVINEYDNKEK